MLADNLAETDAKLFGDTSKYMEADTQVNTLHYIVVEAKVQTLSDGQSDVKLEAMGKLQSR